MDTALIAGSLYWNVATLAVAIAMIALATLAVAMIAPATLAVVIVLAIVVVADTALIADSLYWAVAMAPAIVVVDLAETVTSNKLLLLSNISSMIDGRYYTSV